MMQKLSFLLMLWTFFCLNLSHAQDNPATAVLNQTLPTIQPTPGSDKTSPETPPPDDVKFNGKYEEFMSICRKNEYDQIKDLPQEVKLKRIALIKEKIESSSDKIKFKMRLIKEYIDQGSKKAIEPLVKELKGLTLSNYNNDYLNALTSFADGNLPAARTTLNKLIAQNPDNVDVLKFLSEIFTEEENYYEASTIFEDLNKKTKDMYLPQLCETMILNSLNADGEKICLEAIKKFKDNPVPQIFIGISYREREDLKKARAAFKKSIQMKPSEMGYVCLAETFSMQNQFSEAITNFKSAIELRPSSIRAILGLAWSQLKSKNYEESLANFKKACKINGKYQTELRKAFKELSADKIPSAKYFIQAAETCTTTSAY